MIRLLLQTIVACAIGLLVYLQHYLESAVVPLLSYLSSALDRTPRLLAWQPDRAEWESFQAWAAQHLPGGSPKTWVRSWSALPYAVMVAGAALLGWDLKSGGLERLPPWWVIALQLLVVAIFLWWVGRWLDRLLSEWANRTPRYELRGSGVWANGLPAVRWRSVESWGRVVPGIWLKGKASVLSTDLRTRRRASVAPSLICVPEYLRPQVEAIIEQHCPGKRLAAAPPELTEPAIAPSR